jgi:DNA-binding SARP family transcriptional activator
VTAQAARPGAAGQIAGEAQLHLLGGFELRIGAAVVDIQRASQRLLALLALAGVAVERSFAAFQLWPDACQQRAQANLRSTVWRLRHCPGDLVKASKTHVGLSAAVWVDVRQGLAEVHQADADVAPPLMSGETTLLADLLPDWYDDWLTTERERIRQLRLAALERYGDRLLDSGQISEAIQVGLRAVAIEPLRESPHRLVIRCHLAEGNVVEAVWQYERYASLLDRELGTVPSPRMRELTARFSPPGRGRETSARGEAQSRALAAS